LDGAPAAAWGQTAAVGVVLPTRIVGNDDLANHHMTHVKNPSFR
jgi:hypothetical protein